MCPGIEGRVTGGTSKKKIDKKGNCEAYYREEETEAQRIHFLSQETPSV